MNPMFEDEAPAKPVWLTTLADLALLLVGFFVFLQANQMDGKAFASSVRAGFGVTEAEAAMPVEMAYVAGFAAGSAVPGDSSTAREWARVVTRDPRTLLVITGEVDGSPQDVDPATGSGAILAADRARAVAALLVASRAIAPARIRIVTSTDKRRTVLTLGFEGDRQ
ncbi:MAG: flagellar motor protein MotB [Sphingomonadales bacterium]|nr:MAG: flagellar motor protein MotB [Sphingomonadales bacterium]